MYASASEVVPFEEFAQLLVRKVHYISVDYSFKPTLTLCELAANPTLDTNDNIMTLKAWFWEVLMIDVQDPFIEESWCEFNCPLPENLHTSNVNGVDVERISIYDYWQKQPSLFNDPPVLG